jgi:hypothetical protein
MAVLVPSQTWDMRFFGKIIVMTGDSSNEPRGHDG